MSSTSQTGVTTKCGYDAFERETSVTDGRGNTTRTVYDAFGRIASSIDALGYSTAYGYDALGRQVSVTDPLGHTVTTAYDPEGHVISQRGATYPVDYFYDEFGDKISMTTYRDINAAGEVTRWLRDEATGLVTNKVYADGKGPRYDYTPDGKLATRTWARGIVTTYSYDDNGALTNTVYSDGTPTISLAYNRAGRQVRAHDAAGVTIFLYDGFGAVTNETVLGVAGTNTIERFYDSFGRSLGYALNGIRQSTLAYDPATGRLASMQIPSEQSNNPNNQTIKQFSWNYLAGSNFKSSLSYPNGLTVSWQYDANNQLLQVRNAFPTNTISQYDYVYDAAGCRISMSKTGTAFDQSDTISYGYNTRSELTNAVASVDSCYRYAYDFDDIGNRESSSERGTNSVCAANNLNQYTAITDVSATPSSSQTFQPQFDDDGNQTLIKTATGIWSVTYNGENRPILWSCIQSNNSNNTNNQTILSMSYDRMGRRVSKNNLRFVYDGYLQVANFEHSTSNIELQTFIWDPTETVATRPLAWLVPRSLGEGGYYTYDGNKNVSEVVADNGEVSAHYEYAPFGSILVTIGECASANPWRFSSEYAEDDSATVYYNYRHFNPWFGRWCCADPIGDVGGLNSYLLCRNMVTRFVDCIGLFSSFIIETHQNIVQAAIDDMIKDGDVMCLADAKRRRQIVEYLKYTNAKMDSKYSDDKYLEMHFNRIKGDHDEYKAIVSYTNYLWTWDAKIESSILEGGNDGCRSALRSLGELTHMLQDYYGHGVSFDYNDGDVDIEIGYAVGDPYNPLMKPSDYNGYVGGSEHGRIWDSEPGIRAPDGPANPHLPITWDYDVGRLGMAKEETKKAFNNYLRKWCEKCCKARIPLVGRARPRSPHSGRRH